MTRYELNTNMEYIERRRIKLADMIVDHETLTNEEVIEMIYGLYGLCFIILNEIRVQKEKEKRNV